MVYETTAEDENWEDLMVVVVVVLKVETEMGALDEKTNRMDRAAERVR